MLNNSDRRVEKKERNMLHTILTATRLSDRRMKASWILFRVYKRSRRAKRPGRAWRTSLYNHRFMILEEIFVPVGMVRLEHYMQIEIHLWLFGMKVFR